MFGKLFASMYDGTLGTKGPWQALVTFQQMIVLCDKDGTLDMTPEALSRRTSIPLEIIMIGIAALEAPDPKSRTPDEEGRRITRLADNREWGWHITNYQKYREIRSAEERREYNRRYWRDKRSPVTGINRKSTNSTETQQTQPIAVSSKQRQEAEAEATTQQQQHAESFVEPAHRTAYLQLRERARNAASFDAMLGTIVAPIAGGKAYSWLIVGQAMLEMQSAQATPSAAAIRSFCRRLSETPLGRKGGATGDGIDWSAPIPDGPIFGGS